MLGQFPFHTLKIDRSFVIDRSAHATSFLQCIVGLARALDLTTVAEGLETEEDTAKLLLVGATYGQGFGISRPAEKTVILEQLEALKPASATVEPQAKAALS